jgi:prevent-host-death family protein
MPLALDKAHLMVRIFSMKRTYSIKEAQSQFPGLVREAEEGGMATITRHEKAVAYVMGADDLAALMETTELLASPAARKAIADAEAGRGRVYTLDDLGE